MDYSLGLLLIILAVALGISASARVSGLRRELDEARNALRDLALRLILLEGAVGAPKPPPSHLAAPAPAGPVAPQGPAPRPSAGPPAWPAAAAPSSGSGPAPPAAAPARGPAGMALPEGLEEKLGTRLTVWIGSLALALAGAYLVKYSFEKGLLSPPVRVALGLAFGVALLAAGEWMRERSGRVAQGLSAAGVADLFASLLAGVHLYHLIPPAVGFALMALTTAAAVLLSLRQGPLIALLGLVGGFLTPAWIGSDEPRPGPLFAYLFLLQSGLIVVTRRRRWWAISALTVTAGMGWAAVWIMGRYAAGDGVWVGLYLLGTVAAFALAARAGRDATAGAAPGAGATAGTGALRDAGSLLANASAALGLLLVGAMVGRSGFAPLEWGFLGLLGAGCLVLGRLDPAYRRLGWLASGAGLAMLAAWNLGSAPIDAPLFARVAISLGLLYFAGAYACLWGSARPGEWASLSVASAVGYLLVAYWVLDRRAPDFPWGLVSLLLAAAATAAALPVARRRERIVSGDQALAALAVGVTALVSLAVPLELERAWITVAWALEVPAVAWIERRLRVRELRPVAWVLAAAVAVRLLLNPSVLFYPIGSLVVLNWLLYGYGVPAVSFAVAAALFRRGGDARLAEALEGGTLALGWVLLTLEIRHYFHSERLHEIRFDLAEWGAYSVAWLACARGLLAAALRWPRRTFTEGAKIATAIALAQAILAQGLAHNPLWTQHPVGSLPVLNALLFVYGLPAALALLVGREFQDRGERSYAGAAAVAGLVLLFLLVTLEVRQAFHGSILVGGTTSNAEWYSYSFAWIVLGTLLLVLGISTRGPVLRYASLAVMLLAVGKVFLFDTAELKDLYRVFSFLGLGASLLLLGYLYQRFVFRGGTAR